MLRNLTFSIVAVCAACLLASPLRSDQALAVHGRRASLAGRGFDHQPMPRYQADHLFSVDGSRTAIWVEPVSGARPETSIARAVTLPDSTQVLVEAVAVSFDGDIAVSADAMDRDGQLVSVIAWLDADGSPARIVRTSPFAPTGIGFTADGSLWAVGIEKLDRSTSHPSHDTVRQYDSAGTLVRSLLPRSEFPDDHWHPAYRALMATSRHYVAFISREARTWTVVSSAGIVTRHGALNIPGTLRVNSVSVTDSGRVFVNCHEPDDPKSYLFEVGNRSAPDSVTTTGFLPAGQFRCLTGSDGESLVFLSEAKGQDPELVWATID